MKSRIVELEVKNIVCAAGGNPRQRFDEQKLLALGESMEHETQLAPVIVNRVDGVNYLIAGERRMRAAVLAKQGFIEARVFEDLIPLDAARMQASENLQRVELNAIEQAQTYAKLADLDMAISDIAAETGASEETVKRRLSLLELSNTVQVLITREIYPLPIHQALLLKGLAESDQIKIAREAAPMTGPIASEAEVRELVAEIKHGPRLNIPDPQKKTPSEPQDPSTPQQNTPPKDQPENTPPDKDDLKLKPVAAQAVIKGKIVLANGCVYFQNATVTVKIADDIEIMHEEEIGLDVSNLAAIAKLVEKNQPKKAVKKKTVKKKE